MGLISQLVAGLIFGIGLIVSGMINPAKVQNFLDVAGSWDPSLAFVMAGAIAVAVPAFWIASRRARPAFAPAFELPRADAPVTTRLVGGAAIFGAGWGLAGFCPGPAIASLGLGAQSTLLFVAAMLAGVLAADRFLSRRSAEAAV